MSELKICPTCGETFGGRNGTPCRCSGGSSGSGDGLIPWAVALIIILSGIYCAYRYFGTGPGEAFFAGELGEIVKAILEMLLFFGGLLFVCMITSGVHSWLRKLGLKIPEPVVLIGVIAIVVAVIGYFL